MTVFKTFLKVLNAYKVTIIIYTVFLIGFGAFNLQTSDNSTTFVAKKPNILVINQDSDNKITNNLASYIKQNSNPVDIKDDKNAINDALFYRDIHYIIYLPNHYGENFLKGENPTIEVKSTGNYQSSLAKLLLEQYVKVANTYRNTIQNEEELIQAINDTLAIQTEVEITSKLDTTSLAKASFYYNFANYSILAGCVFVICIILSSFRQDKIRKRTIISSMNERDYNRKLLLSNSLFAITLWFLYVVISFLLISKVMFTMHGVLLMINSFIFTLCALSIAFLLSSFIRSKNALNGIVNVLALGTSFLCGAFVPMELLPDSILKIAHILPSYYYINNNELIKKLETFNLEHLQPLVINMGIILLFTICFIILTNIITRKKRKISN